MSDAITRGLFEAIPLLRGHHNPQSAVYSLLKNISRDLFEKKFSSVDHPQELGPFGQVSFPFISMGGVTSVDLFGLDELIIFSFYWANKGRYKRVVDVGGNLGLHSIIMDRCGYDVRTYEPDPHHFQLLTENLKKNNSHRVVSYCSAVSEKSGEAEFIRVLGNTTGSHIAGAKTNVYGDIQKFMVPLVPIGELLEWADLIKIDAEGHEKEILLGTEKKNWAKVDAMVEIGSASNAESIFTHFRRLRVSLFSQKKNWERVESPSDMPHSYKDGSLFISEKTAVPW